MGAGIGLAFFGLNDTEPLAKTTVAGVIPGALGGNVIWAWIFPPK